MKATEPVSPRFPPPLEKIDLISLAVLWWGRRFTGWFGILLVGLIVGGAWGNTVDRLQYGAVADFLNVTCCGLRNPYAFNVADVAIFAGAVGLILFTGQKNPA